MWRCQRPWCDGVERDSLTQCSKCRVGEKESATARGLMTITKFNQYGNKRDPVFAAVHVGKYVEIHPRERLAFVHADGAVFETYVIRTKRPKRPDYDLDKAVEKEADGCYRGWLLEVQPHWIRLWMRDRHAWVLNPLMQHVSVGVPAPNVPADTVHASDHGRATPAAAVPDSMLATERLDRGKKKKKH